MLNPVKAGKIGNFTIGAVLILNFLIINCRAVPEVKTLGF
jgi:hypothetical protein